ncbi:MAG: FkbM family methyltransferase [Alphaproteobacteria bacterium]
MNRAFVRQVGPARWLARSALRYLAARVLGRTMRLRLPTGTLLALPPRNPVASEVYVTGADVDWGAEAILARFAERDRDFVDVGANIGYYAVYLAPLVRRVVAFEPDPRNLPALAANAAAAGNVTVRPVAVSDRCGTGRLSVGSSSAVGHLVGAAEKDALPVETTTIDAAADALDLRPCAIKLDIEGHELAALAGAAATIGRHQPLILTEFARPAGGANDADGLARLLADHGYGLYAPVARARPRAPSRLRRLDPQTIDAAPTKMLFLVPPRLAGDFAGLADAA